MATRVVVLEVGRMKWAAARGWIRDTSHEGLRQPLKSTILLRCSLPMTFDEHCTRKTNDVDPKIVAPGRNPIEILLATEVEEDVRGATCPISQ